MFRLGMLSVLAVAFTWALAPQSAHADDLAAQGNGYGKTVQDSLTMANQNLLADEAAVGSAFLSDHPEYIRIDWSSPAINIETGYGVVSVTEQAIGIPVPRETGRGNPVSPIEPVRKHTK